MVAKQTRNPADRAVASIQAAGPRLARMSTPTSVTMIQTYSAKNPRRPVHWRWQRAALAASGDYPLSRRRDGDMWVARAAKFIREQESCDTELDMAYLSERNPIIFWAYDIWYTRDDSWQPGPQ